MNNPDNADTRAEVLRRIDAMPNVSALNKDKLYASVDHAQGMGRVLTIPFEKGRRRRARLGDRPAQAGTRHARRSRSWWTIRRSYFVVLGYADQKGERRRSTPIFPRAVPRACSTRLRDKCGFQNVMHAVAMGGSTMFSDKQAEKNRVVEIWAVLP